MIAYGCTEGRVSGMSSSKSESYRRNSSIYRGVKDIKISIKAMRIRKRRQMQGMVHRVDPDLSSPLDTPSSPTILVSLSICPSTIFFSPRREPSVPKLVITLTNTTAHAITFQHTFTPLDVERCFIYGGEAIDKWTIRDLTADMSHQTMPIIAVQPPSGTRPYMMTPNDPSSIRYDSRLFITVPPGRNKSVKLTFDMSIRDGLQADHTYALKVRDFEVDAY